MKAFKLNFFIDAISFVVFTFMISTGVIMHYILPPGSGHDSAIWGMNRHGWGSIHFWLAIIFLAIILFHIIRHWDWIVRFVKGRKRDVSKRRSVVGLMSMIVVLALAASPLLSPVQAIERDDHHNAEMTHNYDSELNIRSYMTLSDVSNETGVPVDHILGELEMPPGTDETTKIGSLVIEYGLEMKKVRKAVKGFDVVD